MIGDKFREKHPKLTEFLESKLPKAGDIIGSILPNSGTLGMIKNLITTHPDLSPEDKTEGLRLADEAEQLYLEQEKIDADNTANARDMAIKLAGEQSSWMAKNIGYCLDILVGSIWGALTIMIALRQLKLISIEGADFTGILSLYATVSAIFMTSLNFHRGSTQNGRTMQKQMMDKIPNQ